MARFAVIGAGIAGLAAAWELEAAGHDVVLFEAGTEIGGKLQRRSGGSSLAGFSGTSYAFPPGSSNIRVTLTAGFDVDNPMPADLRMAILKLAAGEFRQRRTSTPTTERSAGTGPERMAIRGDALSVIRSYRQVPGF